MDTDAAQFLLRAVFGFVPRSYRVERLLGQASSRNYYRIHVANEQPAGLIVMELPLAARAEDELRGDKEPAGSEELPFVSVQRLLKARGVRVPAILADQSAVRGLVALEDLGDETLEAALLAAREPDKLMEEAVDTLLAFQAATRTQAPQIAYQRSFDAALFRAEFDHFREWGLDALGPPLSTSDGDALTALFARWTDELAALPRRLVHRDFQSRNLMRHAQEWVLIDFQDALLGPVHYDLAALLCDSYVAHEQALQSRLLARFHSECPEAHALEHDTFWRVALHRKLKDAGRFVFIDRARGNPTFLRWFPQSLRYVDRALQQIDDPGARFLADLLRRVVPGYPDTVPVPPSKPGPEEALRASRRAVN